MKSLSEQIAEHLWQEGREATPARKTSLIKQVMVLLRTQGLLPLLPTVVRALEDRERSALHEYEVSSAEKLSGAARKALLRVLPKGVQPNEIVDTKLIGGLRVKIRDDIYDATIRGGLNQLRNHLKLNT